MTTKTEFLEFPDSPEQAEKRYERFKDNDPFPAISPALLNSADISDYVRVTGTLFPFPHDGDQLKSASYEAAILGLCIYWDENGDRREQTLNRGQKLTLIPNSITFVEVEPFFRLCLSGMQPR